MAREDRNVDYLYYPGCSLRSSGIAYEESLLAVFAALGVPLTELPDWNCCGATAYMSIDEMKSFGLAARNLAIAARERPEGAVMIAPCAACYTALAKAQHYMADYGDVGAKIGDALRGAGLEPKFDVTIRHPLDVLVNDVGLERIASAVKRPLTGMRIACYYGCQIVRPYPIFDDEYDPQTMDRLIEAIGAEPVKWPLKTRCCGGSLTGTMPDVGTKPSMAILQEARDRGAHAVATVCSLCQFNLECFQDRLPVKAGAMNRVPVAYFTQFLGLALGLSEREVGLNRLLVSLDPALAELKRKEHVHA